MHVCVEMDDVHNSNVITVTLYASEQILARDTPFKDRDIYGFYNCLGFEYCIYIQFD